MLFEGQRPAEQLRQQCVAQGGKGAGLLGVAVDAVEHRRRHFGERLDQRGRRNDDLHIEHALGADALVAASGAGDEGSVTMAKADD